ncbi:hypothetical protein [Actinomadura rubrisoli]|uniref:Uncharacterized protein n=1 Tax=Actinomadura rubrisoli TaxID=2530368 RepID=A0A4R4ZP00_9ACTN|nr:hypothetical protein [Actinomadura rubrisoli]TDD60040.1 hypothetical protein E1298_46265 [Actinomadura rubrisoli]
MIIAIATAMAGKAVEVAGEPVRTAVAELANRVRERFRGRAADEEALARATGDPVPERIDALAEAIGRLLDEQPAFNAELRATWTQAQTRATASDDGVVNVFTGTATNIVQARDIQNLNLG